MRPKRSRPSKPKIHAEMRRTRGSQSVLASAGALRRRGGPTVSSDNCAVVQKGGTVRTTRFGMVAEKVGGSSVL